MPSSLCLHQGTLLLLPRGGILSRPDPQEAEITRGWPGPAPNATALQRVVKHDSANAPFGGFDGISVFPRNCHGSTADLPVVQYSTKNLAVIYYSAVYPP